MPLQGYVKGRRPSEGWGPCLSRLEKSSNMLRDIDASFRRWHDDGA